ncbi:MAG: filamentous hemagglutinin N-terminal domain-containing protein, partial [Microcoleus sp. SIO2G3]|nr:filamentous hemagglutinin N-terminal domain-containing protein [Microcoleus sp. SIO2G3]
MDKKIVSEIELQSPELGGCGINNMVYSCQDWGYRCILAACAMSGAIAFSGAQALAQVTPDDSLGADSSVVIPDVDINGIPSDRIDGGVTSGANLFHSFSEFNVDTGRGIYFTNPTGINNILSRVTGGNISNIQGTLGVLGNANLFLINPSGIIFGQNARLDIGGSFVGTTANGIKFGDVLFPATNSPVDLNNSVLAVNPSALFFNQTPAGAIINQSIAPNPDDLTLKDGLRVPDGQNLFLVGGDVRLENGGTVRALGGRIELGGLAEPGEVRIEDFTDDASNPNLNFPLVGLTFPDGVARADVSLTDEAIVDVVALGGGDIAINAENVNVLGNSLICAGIGTAGSSCNTPSSDFGSANPEAGNIVINATGTVSVSQSSRIENDLNPGAIGNPDNIFEAIINGTLFGSILIDAESLFLSDGGQISTSTFGTGSAGLVFVDASNSVSLSTDTSMFSRVEFGATGDAGGILIGTGSLSLTDRAQIDSSTYGMGTAGAVVVEADGAVALANGSYIFSNVESGGLGNAGLIDISAESLSLLSGSQVQTIVRGNEFGQDPGRGSAGTIEIDVRDTITIDGVGVDGFNSAIFSSVGRGATGNSGNIEISTRSLSLSNFGLIDTSLG